MGDRARLQQRRAQRLGRGDIRLRRVRAHHDGDPDPRQETSAARTDLACGLQRADQRDRQEDHIALLARLEPLLDRANDREGQGNGAVGRLFELRRQQLQRLLRRAAAVDAQLRGG
jgi:hypothetical protein